MSLKDFREYVREQEIQRNELMQNLKDYAEYCEKNLVPPETYEEIENNVKPLIDNYERLVYIEYLINKPVKKEKVKKYENQNKKKLSKLDKRNSLESCLKENEDVLKNVQSKMNN